MSLKRFVKRALNISNSASDGTARVERPPAFYDEAYATSVEYKLDYPDSQYYFVWTIIVDRARRLGAKRVLEIGCGPGQLAQFLIDQGVASYTGLDFSATAIELARRFAPTATFVVDDARTSDVYHTSACDLIVCTEVLEHIDADYEVVSKFPSGVRCICTVPSFPYKSHVRHFRNSEEVATRYQPFFNDFSVLTLRRPKRAGSYFFLFEGIRNEHQASC